MVIKSVYSSDKEILDAVLKMHVKDKTFDIDPTYSRGVIYSGLPEPRMKFDLSPQRDDIMKADCRGLPVKYNSVSSIVFDPPFMFGKHGKTDQYRMTKRFTMFDSFDDLKSMYIESMIEFYRAMKNGGHLIFKCQDYTDSKTTMTHCLVWQWAQEIGFYAKDLFILVFPGGRIYNSNLRQLHARKFHSYYWVFQKKKRLGRAG